MNKEILYTTAKDKNGVLIHINNAEKGMSYYCPMCKKEFILRKSGKTGKGSRRPHFSHNELTPNCTPEGVLHYSFKMMLIDLLRKYKAENKLFTFTWACGACSHKNIGNLVERVVLINGEHVFEKCRADIALLDKAEQVVAVIEIVVSHKPEESVIQYYAEKKIALIQINLTSDEDLNKVEEKAKTPDLVDLCLSFKCPNRDKYKTAREIVAFRRQCGSCFGLIEDLFINTHGIFGINRSRDFTDEEINRVKSMASEKGIGVEIGSNNATKERYPVLVCENCRRIRMKYNRRRL